MKCSHSFHRASAHRREATSGPNYPAGGTHSNQSAEWVTCKDGSTSKAGRGECHGHGGVDKTKAAATSEPPAPANASAPPPASKGAPLPSATAPLPTPASHGSVFQHAARSGGKAATDDPTWGDCEV